MKYDKGVYYFIIFIMVNPKPVPEVFNPVSSFDFEATRTDGTTPKQSINANG